MADSDPAVPTMIRMPQSLREALKAEAERNRRTFTAEVLIALEKSVRDREAVGVA